MSNIAHEVGGTVKNLEVTGVVLEMPYPDDIWLNYQIDAGITRASGEITAWQSQGTNSMILSNTSPGAPTDDSAIKLAGLNTVGFNAANSEFLLKGNISPMEIEGQKTITMLIRGSTNHSATQRWLYHSGWTDGHYERVFSIDNPSSGTTLRLYWYNEYYNPTTVDVTITSVLNAWSVITVKFYSDNSAPGLIEVWQDGEKLYSDSHECKIANFMAAAYQWVMGGVSDINIAALLWWNRDMTDEEVVLSHQWLKAKYGLI